MQDARCKMQEVSIAKRQEQRHNWAARINTNAKHFHYHLRSYPLMVYYDLWYNVPQPINYPMSWLTSHKESHVLYEAVMEDVCSCVQLFVSQKDVSFTMFKRCWQSKSLTYLHACRSEKIDIRQYNSCLLTSTPNSQHEGTWKRSKGNEQTMKVK